jgi:NADH-quinone oxidoreductase subunit M
LAAYNPAAGLNVTVYRTYMVIAALGTVLAAAYLLWLYQRTAFGTPKGGHHEEIHDVSTREWVAWLPMLIAIVVLGVLPNLLFSVIDPAVQETLRAFGG